MLPEAEGAVEGREGRGEAPPGGVDEEYFGVIFRGEQTSEPYSIATDTLADLQPRKPLVASAGISLAEAIGQLNAHNVGLLALVDEQGKLAGVFTEGDVFRKVACNITDLASEKVKDYMTPSVTTLKPDSTIGYALHLMSIHKFRHVLIVDDQNRPEGVLSFRAVA
ncbi:MAG: CBS domain-containing protein, partial [Anaerolineae bacterium]